MCGIAYLTETALVSQTIRLGKTFELFGSTRRPLGTKKLKGLGLRLVDQFPSGLPDVPLARQRQIGSP